MQARQYLAQGGKKAHLGSSPEMRTAETNKNEEIAGRKQAEAKRLRIYRAMRMIGACNRGLVMVTNEIDWLNKLCRVLVEEGGCEPYPKWGRQILSSGWM